MRQILSLVGKDVKILLRNRGDLFFVLVWPLIAAIFFGLVFAPNRSGRGKIPIVVVDEDKSPESSAFVLALSKIEVLSVEQAERDAAVSLVRRGRKTAYVALGPGFGEARRRMFYGEPARIELGADPSRSGELALVEGLLKAEAFKDLQRAMSDPSSSRQVIDRALTSLSSADPETQKTTGRFLRELDVYLSQPQPRPGTDGQPPGSAWQPVLIETKSVAEARTGPKNAFEVTFPQGILWGIVGCAASFGVGLVVERRRGTLLRLEVAPITRAQILLGRALACVTAILLVEALLLFIGVVFFHVRPASVLHLLLAGLVAAVGFSGVMMGLSVLGKTEQSAGGLTWAVLLVMSMLGGGMVPLFAMPSWMAMAGHASPVKWAILALEGAIWRGFTTSEMLLPCGILLAVGAFGFALGARLYPKP